MKCTYCKSNILSLLVYENLLCGNLTVTGDAWASVTGTYLISKEKASLSPSMRVFKKQGYDRFIYHTPTSWVLGKREHLSPGKREGHYFFKSKSFFKESLIELYISHIQYA